MKDTNFVGRSVEIEGRPEELGLIIGQRTTQAIVYYNVYWPKDRSEIEYLVTEFKLVAGDPVQEIPNIGLIGKLVKTPCWQIGSVYRYDVEKEMFKVLFSETLTRSWGTGYMETSRVFFMSQYCVETFLFSSFFSEREPAETPACPGSPSQVAG